MECYPKVLILVIILDFNWFELTLSQMQRGNARLRPYNADTSGPPVVCTHDSLIIYQDCRLCICPRSNRIAKCFKKSCDLRTKDGGQCPSTFLKMDDSDHCPIAQGRGCQIDTDCPNSQLCCFDFCGSPRCVEPQPLDASSGTLIHNGRGYPK